MRRHFFADGWRSCVGSIRRKKYRCLMRDHFLSDGQYSKFSGGMAKNRCLAGYQFTDEGGGCRMTFGTNVSENIG
jgi:hypothetical protein